MKRLRALVAIASVPAAACSLAYLNAGDDGVTGSDAGPADAADERVSADADDVGEIGTCDGKPCVPRLAFPDAGAWKLFVANELTWVRCTGRRSVAVNAVQKDGGDWHEDTEIANVSGVTVVAGRTYVATDTNIIVATDVPSTYATVGASSIVATTAGVFFRSGDRLWACDNPLACVCDGGTCGESPIGMSESQLVSGVDFQLMAASTSKVSVIRLKALGALDFHTLAIGDAATGVSLTLVAGSQAFWAQSSRLYRTTISDAQGPPDVLAEVAGAGDITGIVMHGAFVYFATGGTGGNKFTDGALYRVRATGGAPTKVVGDLAGPHSLVLDEIAVPPALYWASFEEEAPVTAPADAYCVSGKGSIFALDVPD